jgi:hypothetical protein
MRPRTKLQHTNIIHSTSVAIPERHSRKQLEKCRQDEPGLSMRWNMHGKFMLSSHNKHLRKHVAPCNVDTDIHVYSSSSLLCQFCCPRHPSPWKSVHLTSTPCPSRLSVGHANSRTCWLLVLHRLQDTHSLRSGAY